MAPEQPLPGPEAAPQHPQGDQRPTGHQVALTVASDYMRLSRATSLEQVYAMFSDDAAYLSDALGTRCEGLSAIRAMMDGFFTRFPDVRWEVVDLRVVEEEEADGAWESRPGAVKVAVEFERYWTSESGEALRRTGREWIYVDPESARIVFVHVAALDP